MARVEMSGKGSKFILLASSVLVIAGLYFGREVLVPLAMGILLSFLLTPAVLWLERFKLPRAASVLIVVGVTCAALGGLTYVVGRQFVSVVDQLPNYQGELRTKIERIRSHGGFFKKLENEAKSISAGTTQPAQATQPKTAATPAGEPLIVNTPSPLNGPPAQPLPPTSQPTVEHPLPVRVVEQTTPVQLFEQYASTFLSPMANAGLILVLVIFMLLNREDLRDRMIRLMGHGRLNLTTQALDDTGSRISRYLGALAIVNVLYGVATAIGLWAIGRMFGHGVGFPNVLVWGLLVGLSRFVPYIGIWIGAAVPLILSFALFPGSAVFVSTIVLFAFLEVVVSQFVEPFWYGASTGMSALAVLVAAVFWTWLWGPIGLLLSTPLTVCLVVLGKYVPALRFLDILLGDEPVLPPHVRVYQRLIASDEEEASELVHALREDEPLEVVYDRVLVPALALAELDHHRGTLDPEQLEFVQQSVRDIVDEMGDEEAARRTRDAAERTEQAAKDKAPASKPVGAVGGTAAAPAEDGNALPAAPPAGNAPPPRFTVPKDCRVNLLILPAKGVSDEIVGHMLHQLLELRGYCPATASVTALASEMVEMISSKNADLIAVSAMPPAAVAHARYLCKRIHLRFPDIPMAVALWNAKGDLRKAKSRIACDEAVPVVTTLAQMQHEIDQLAQPILVRNNAPAETAARVG